MGRKQSADQEGPTLDGVKFAKFEQFSSHPAVKKLQDAMHQGIVDKELM